LSEENKARHLKNCVITSEITPEEHIIQVEGSRRLKVPLQKRKEDAKQILYFDRV